MKILSASQIRSADAYTIEHEPVSSINLMERAAAACVEWITKNVSKNLTFRIFCGPGNNGGDGLAIGRMLIESGFEVDVFIIHHQGKNSHDFIENEKRLRKISGAAIHEINSAADFPKLKKNDCVIDALFGTGLSKPVTGLFEEVIKHINESTAEIISIDIPSGLFTDQHTEGNAVIKAKHTLSFQVPKLSFMFAENEKYVGQFHVLEIGLDKKYISGLDSKKIYLRPNFLRPLLKSRNKFSHKGTYGHALLIAGSKGKMGAAVLAAKGCLRTGVGLLSTHVPDTGVDIMQVSCPEAMIDNSEIDFEKYSGIGIGPGIGMEQEARILLRNLMQSSKMPVVLDADALNIISEEKDLLKLIPLDSILTPHPKEFERLAGKTMNNFERHELQLFFSRNHNVIVVLKGANTCITAPDGYAFFNSTGNPGMAKGGNGDILTGMITSLLSQGYSPLESSLLGVYLHGLAGDIAAEKKGMDGMIARDVVNGIAGAWNSLRL